MPSGEGQPRVSLEAHRIIEMTLGLLLIVLPAFLNFQLGGFVLSVGAGVLIGGLGIAATREGRQVGGATHRGADLLLIGLLVVAVAVSAAVNTKAAPTVTLAAAAAVYALLTALTRYSEPTRREP